MCPDAARLRAAWYATATPLPMRADGPNDADWLVLEADRRKKAYRDALGDYIQHRANCPACRAEMKPPAHMTVRERVEMFNSKVRQEAG